MAARRYEISRVKIYFSTPEEKFRISNRPRNVLFIINLLFNTMKYQTISLVHPSLPSLATEDKKQFL